MRRFIPQALAVGLLALAAAVLTTGAVAANHRGAGVKLGHSSLGRIIVDSHGRALYLFGHDRHGKSSCYGMCATYWPALITHGKPRAINGAHGALLGTTRRRNGSMQVTYNRHPLYYYAGDSRPGQIAGAGQIAFGGRWDPVSATGRAVRKSPMKQGAFERPKIKHGVLTIVGTAMADRIALRLKAGDPGTL